jgi:hypothetical protein
VREYDDPIVSRGTATKDGKVPVTQAWTAKKVALKLITLEPDPAVFVLVYTNRSVEDAAVAGRKAAEEEWIRAAMRDL